MKREIKFRGLSRSTNKMVYGMLMYSVSDTGLVIVETVNIPPTFSDPCGDTVNIYNGIVHGSEGEYTGLKDENGVEIYEGDIVDVGYIRDRPYTHVYVVKYSDTEAAFWLIDPNEPQYCKGRITKNNINGKNKVFKKIGNIHENPDLLQKKG